MSVMTYSLRSLQSFLHHRTHLHKCLKTSSQQLKGRKLRQQTESASLGENKLDEDSNLDEDWEGTIQDFSQVAVEEGEGIRGYEVVPDPLCSERVKVTVGEGALRATSDVSRNEMGVMRWTVGKVKGRMKTEILPVEIIPPNMKVQSWKSRNRIGNTVSVIQGGRRTYEDHFKVLEKSFKGKAYFYVSQLNNSNLVEKEHELSRADGRELETIPSLLGVTSEEVLEVMKRIKAAGFSDEEAAAVVGVYPQCMVVNWENVHDTVRFLTDNLKLLFGRVVALMERHPYMFTQKSKKMQSYVKVYKEQLGLSSDNIEFLLNNVPAITYGPLEPRVLDILKRIKASNLMDPDGLTHMIAYELVVENLPVEVTDNTILLASILHNYKVEPCLLLKNEPRYYQQDGKKLLSVIEVLSGRPMYLDWVTIGAVLSGKTNYLYNLSGEEMETHIYKLLKYVPEHILKNWFLSKTAIMDPRCPLDTVLSELHAAGFSDDHIRSMYSILSSIIVCNEVPLEPRVRLLMTIPGVDVDFLSSNIKYMLPTMTGVSGMRERIDFAKKHKPELYSVEKIEDLFCSSNKKFSEICKCHYSGSEVELRPVLSGSTSIDTSGWDKSVEQYKKLILGKLASNTPSPYKTSCVPSLIGATVEDLQARFSGIVEADLQLYMRKFISSFPLAIRGDWKNASRILSAARGHTGVADHSHVLVQDDSVVQKNVADLTSLWRDDVYKLLDKFPMLYYLPLRPSVLENIRVAMTSKHITMEGLLHMFEHSKNIHLRPIAVNENNILLSSVLHNFKANPSTTLKAFPQYYLQNGKVLHEVVSCLQDKPLCLSDKDMGACIEKYADILCSIADKAKLQAHLSNLVQVISPAMLRKKLMACGNLVSPNCLVTDKLQAMEGMGFEGSKLKKMVQTHPELLVLDLEELRSRTSLLLGISGVDCTTLAQQSEYLLLSQTFLKHRLQVASAHKPELVEVSRLKDLLSSSDTKFAKMCGMTLLAYQKETEQARANYTSKRRKVTRTKARLRTLAEIESLIESENAQSSQEPVALDDPSEMLSEEDDLEIEEFEDLEELGPEGVKEMLRQLNVSTSRDDIKEWEDLEEDYEEEEELLDYSFI